MATSSGTTTQSSVRGNSVPTGGTTSTTTTGTQKTTDILPSTATLQTITESFMESSEHNCIQLNKAALLPGQQISYSINNIGLGESLEQYITGSISFKNTLASAQVVNIAPEFPFNLISNMYSQFNGQTVLNSLTGYELLGIMAKRYKNVFQGAASSGGAALDIQNNATVDKSMAWIKAGANITLTCGAPALTGVTSLSVAASSTGVITFGMYLRLPYTLRDDMLLGLIPMQNNSINLNIYVTSPTLLGTTPASPFYVPTAVPATLTNDTNAITIQPTYNFWAIPSSGDTTYYSYLISHSYMLLSQPNNTISASGTEALQYTLPNNYYLMAILFTLRDSGGSLVNMQTGINNPYLSYNGTARVDRRDINTRMARQALYYEGIPSALGQLIWDGTDIAYLSNGTNTSQWLNMYSANNPQFLMDIQAATAVPGTYSVLREQLVPANVSLV